MKKPIYLLAGLFTIACLFSCLLSCRDMTDVYKEFVVKGGLKYPQKADSLKVYPGYNRLRMTWLKAMDPGVVRAGIYWNNYLDTMRIDLTDRQDGVVTVDIDDLAEGNYTFYVKTFDGNGNTSLTVEASGYTYGENYVNRLVERSVVKASRDDNGVCTIEWDVKTPDLLYTQVRYRTLDGEEMTINVMPDDVSTVCGGIEPDGEVEYRSIFLPAGGIDEIALSWNRL